MTWARRASSAAAIAALLALLAGCANDQRPIEPTDTVQPTDATPAEFTGTKTEWVTQLVDCLAEVGWDVSFETDPVSGEPVIASNVPDSQNDAFDAAMDECKGSLPSPPEADTDEELRQYYDSEVERHGCMVAAGYPSESPPSFDSWLETVRAGDVQWMPEDGLTEADMAAATQECPRDPDAWW